MVRKLLIALTTVVPFALAFSVGAQASVSAQAAAASRRSHATVAADAHRSSVRRPSHRVVAKPRRRTSTVHGRRLVAHVATVDQHTGGLQTSAIGAY
jgi:hypothetical protein